MFGFFSHYRLRLRNVCVLIWKWRAIVLTLCSLLFNLLARL